MLKLTWADSIVFFGIFAEFHRRIVGDQRQRTGNENFSFEIMKNIFSRKVLLNGNRVTIADVNDDGSIEQPACITKNVLKNDQIGTKLTSFLTRQHESIVRHIGRRFSKKPPHNAADGAQ